MWRLGRSNAEQLQVESEEDVHRKRVSQILRYISTMQSNGVSSYSFVRPIEENNNAPMEPFFKHAQQGQDEEDLEGGRVLFSTYDFQQLTSILLETNHKTTPFSFYTSNNNAKNANTRKRKSSGSLKRGASAEDVGASSCWMRLTRVAPPSAPPSTSNANVQLYLQNWNRRGNRLTLDHLKHAPPTNNASVKRFLKDYKKYLHLRRLQRKLEPIYNGLFEWYQQGAGGEQLDLIWGLGQVTYVNEGTMVDGPLLEVRVEVELARDGALLVRPKNHVGVSLNRAVLGQLSVAKKDDSILRTLNQTVEQLDTMDISPGEPATYIPLLKRIAVQLSSGGTFSSSKTAATKRLEPGKMVVTDAWCVYASPRPSAVWARDALAFAEKKRETVDFPRAMKALTHGPSALEETKGGDETKKRADSPSLMAYFFKGGGSPTKKRKVQQEDDKERPTTRPQFPLPTSDAQDQIAELLLTKQYPAVVCEGPPGTGKTHTIANIVCAYLCQGKRVLVTSKGAPALSVLRERLPSCVQELCVDVSMGESAGMRQLQQTVERLANKVSWVNTERETSRSKGIQDNIDNLENDLKEIDLRLLKNAEQKRGLVQTEKGQELFEKSLSLIESCPWLMKSVAVWEINKLVSFHKQIASLVVETNDPMNWVAGYPMPPSDALISLAASKAGNVLSVLKNATKTAIVSMPLIGEQMSQHQQSLKEELDRITIKGAAPQSKADWKLVFKTLEREKAIASFCDDSLKQLTTREEWPEDAIAETQDDKRRIKSAAVQLVETTVKVKKLSIELGVGDHIKQATEMRTVETRRAAISARIQQLAEELVACSVVAELSRNFSADAQSALVKFAQVSGKAKFGKSSQPSKMTQRQRRKRQEYLNAFEKCVRYIPCWILTSSQISDYLPPEQLFDLVVIDEASQSDVTVLPGMLRGKQWLIVGDGKQVSPTESFVSEEQIELLKAAAPESPFEASMLPGHSFFDLCAEAFPKGRVILREHFRCAPEIISYSNSEFYNENLIPLRLPKSTERLTPSLVDVRVPNGRKRGKVNEEECDEIVRRIKKYVESCTLVQKRSIGVISFVGDEQSRLIRGRLLDSIGPHKFKLHEILVGEPPSFQGAERDIVFLSLVSSPGSVVTQTQSMHAQRVNVALSRARDRMVLVRSIDTNHIPNPQDIQFTILDFFERAALGSEDETASDVNGGTGVSPTLSALSPFQGNLHRLLQRLLEDLHYVTRSMGVVWENGLCVEDSSNGSDRVAICIEAWGESNDEWRATIQQQRSIERVGWKCLRVDALSLMSNHSQTLEKIKFFLSEAGVFPHQPPAVEDAPAEEEVVEQLPAAEAPPVDDAESDNEEEQIEVAQDEENARGDNIVTISDDEDSRCEKQGSSNTPLSDRATSFESESLGAGEHASDYGNIANLDFLRGANNSFGNRRAAGSGRKRQPPADASDPEDDLEEEQQDHSISESEAQSIPAAAVARGAARGENEEGDYLELDNDSDTAAPSVARARLHSKQNVSRPNKSRANRRETSRSRATDSKDINSREYATSENEMKPVLAADEARGATQGKIASGDKMNFDADFDMDAGSRNVAPPNSSGVHRKKTRRPRGKTELDSDDDLDRKQQAILESDMQTFTNEDVSGSSTDEDQGVPNSAASAARSRASKSSKRRRTRLDKYSRDGRYYHKRSERQDDMTYDEYIEEVLPETIGNDDTMNADTTIEQANDSYLSDGGHDDSDAPYEED